MLEVVPDIEHSAQAGIEIGIGTEIPGKLDFQCIIEKISSGSQGDEYRVVSPLDVFIIVGVDKIARDEPRRQGLVNVGAAQKVSVFSTWLKY